MQESATTVDAKLKVLENQKNQLQEEVQEQRRLVRANDLEERFLARQIEKIETTLGLESKWRLYWI
jgi:hypothetical protein